VPAIYAVTNPLVNSYKRTFEKRIRVRTRRGEDVKVELCFPDPTANPYLALAVIIQAGIKGVEKKQAPAKDLLLQDLPEDLKEAVRNLQSDEVIRQAMGTDFASLYAEVKLDEWREYLAEISRWELQKYLYRV
jgi:glutamine synthetase